MSRKNGKDTRINDGQTNLSVTSILERKLVYVEALPVVMFKLPKAAWHSWLD